MLWKLGQSMGACRFMWGLFILNRVVLKGFHDEVAFE